MDSIKESDPASNDDRALLREQPYHAAIAIGGANGRFRECLECNCQPRSLSDNALHIEGRHAKAIRTFFQLVVDPTIHWTFAGFTEVFGEKRPRT